MKTKWYWYIWDSPKKYLITECFSISWFYKLKLITIEIQVLVIACLLIIYCAVHLNRILFPFIIIAYSILFRIEQKISISVHQLKLCIYTIIITFPMVIKTLTWQRQSLDSLSNSNSGSKASVSVGFMWDNSDHQHQAGDLFRYKIMLKSLDTGLWLLIKNI